MTVFRHTDGNLYTITFVTPMGFSGGYHEATNIVTGVVVQLTQKGRYNMEAFEKVSYL